LRENVIYEISELHIRKLKCVAHTQIDVCLPITFSFSKSLTRPIKNKNLYDIL